MKRFTEYLKENLTTSENSDTISIRGKVKELIEGNPLSRIQGKHSIIMSAERKGLTPEQNKSRMSELKKDWRDHGYGTRNTEGKWNEGGGVGTENSVSVIQRGTGKRAGAKLRMVARKLSTKYNQDAFIHRKPDGQGTAIYTGTEKKRQKINYGPSRYNVPNPDGETTFKIRRSERSRPKLAFLPKDG